MVIDHALYSYDSYDGVFSETIDPSLRFIEIDNQLYHALYKMSERALDGMGDS